MLTPELPDSMVSPHCALRMTARRELTVGHFVIRCGIHMQFLKAKSGNLKNLLSYKRRTGERMSDVENWWRVGNCDTLMVDVDGHTWSECPWCLLAWGASQQQETRFLLIRWIWGAEPSCRWKWECCRHRSSASRALPPSTGHFGKYGQNNGKGLDTAE